jgi:peptide/nickel transport system permease protein
MPANTGFARVVENERLYGDTYITWFAAPELARAATPGQFVMLRCGEAPVEGEAPPTALSLPDDPLLPRAMSIHRLRERSGAMEWAVLYDVVGRGTAWLASRRGTWVEHWGIPAVLATRAAPEFWVGMLALAVFSFSLNWFPFGGATSPGSAFPSWWAQVASLDFLHHLALPALTLALYLQGLPTLLMRNSMLEVMEEDFITFCRMRGLPERTIVLRHAARNALLPVVTAFALGVGYSIGGNVIIETVFSWPGLGRTLVRAVAAKDYPVAQAAFLMIAAVMIAMNFIADLLYSLLDPRVSHERR